MILQVPLLLLYRLAAATGVLRTRPGRALFERAYWLYKGRYEAASIQPLRSLLRANTWVIDVGANIGFFSLHFAEWGAGRVRVLAVEPESLNFARLQKAIVRAGRGDVVETLRAAVAERIGEAYLEINPVHPGDHKLGAGGQAVPLTTIDQLLAERGWPEVSLIKIDVQGAEPRVLAGAAETLRRRRPPLFIEVHAASLRAAGSSSDALLTAVAEQGYRIHQLQHGTITPALTVAGAVRAAAAKGYEDFLMLPDH